MKRTKPNGRLPRVTVDEALQILQSAVGYCQLAGLTVRGSNSETGLTLVIPGVFYTLGPTNSDFEFRVGSLRTHDDTDEREARKKAMLYARSATGQADAIAEQIESCRTWATVQGYRVSEAYADGGSGNDPNLPERAKAIAKAASESAVLVCVEPSRLARDPRLLMHGLSDCKRHGVTVCFVKE